MNETFQRYAQNHHEMVRQWKDEYKKSVFGYFCCTVPEEIIFAADALPVRIVGTSDPLIHAQLHVPPNSCPFAPCNVLTRTASSSAVTSPVGPRVNSYTGMPACRNAVSARVR